MKFKEILEMLEEIEGQLDDSFYSLPEWDGNSEGRSSLDGARNDLYNLKDEIEKVIINESFTFGGDTGVDADFGMK